MIHVWPDTPERVLDAITEINAVLAKYPKNPKTAFWYRVSDTLRMAYIYMTDLQWIHDRNKILEAENAFLIKRLSEIEARLLEYETIERAGITGRLPGILKIVEKKMAAKGLKLETNEQNSQETTTDRKISV